MKITRFSPKVILGACTFCVVISTGLLATTIGVASEKETTTAETTAAETTTAETTTEDNKTVTMNLTDAAGIGEAVGTVLLEDSDYGLILTPSLTGLTPGIHGFHIHANAACGPGEKDGNIVPGLAAGGHYDPTDTGSHEGPYGEGHLGDLPPLYVEADGSATTPILAPRLSLADVENRALMVHMHGDNFSDEPAALGGGGPRLACGVIE